MARSRNGCSTSPANAAVPYGERLRWFAALRAWIEPEHRRAVRAIVVDARDRVLLLHWQGPTGSWWITPGGGVAVGEELLRPATVVVGTHG
mgnify:CR=1 FL=1